MSSLQAQIEKRGERIFDLVDRHPESIFSKAGFYQRMMALSMRDEHFKVQMFRFVDVLASLQRSGDIVQHLEEYFAPAPAGRDGFAAYKPRKSRVASPSLRGFAPVIHTGVRLARIVPWLSSMVLRRNVSGMARQFIAGKNPDDVMKTLRKRRQQNIGFTVDLLGEAVVSETEAGAYAARCLELLEHLARERRGWTDPLGTNSELFPVVNQIQAEWLGFSGLSAEAGERRKLRGAYARLARKRIDRHRCVRFAQCPQHRPCAGAGGRARHRPQPFRVPVPLRHGRPDQARAGGNGLSRPRVLPGGRVAPGDVVSRSAFAREHFQ